MDNQTPPVNGGTSIEVQIPAPLAYSSRLIRPGIDNRKTPSGTRLFGTSNDSSNSNSSSGTSSSSDLSIFDDNHSCAGTRTPPTDDESSGSMSVVSRRLSRLEINSESPIALKEKRRNHTKLAKAAEEARSIAGIFEDPESGQETEGIDEAVQEPEEINEVVASGNFHGPQLGQQQQIPLGVADTASSGEVEIVSPTMSGMSLLPEKVDEQSDAATAPTTRPPTPISTPISTPDETAKSALEDGLDAKASSNIDRQGELVEGSGSTSVEVVTPPRDLLKTEPRRSSRVKENLAATEARANKTTAAAATGVDPASTGDIASSQSSRKGKGANTKAPSANAASSTAATGQSRRSTKRSATKPRGTGLDSIPIFSNFGEQLTAMAVHDNILKTLKYNGTDKLKSRTSPKVKTEPAGYGFMYIYTSPLCAGYVKIGTTSETPHTRVSQWEGRCKLETILMKDSERHKFLHFQLAEKLIQKELHNYRSKYRCHHCRIAHKNPSQEDTNMVQHGEWFKISEELALATVQKWRRWLVTNRPYNTDGVLRPSWNEKYKVFVKKTALMDSEEWVEAWIQPLTIKETIIYFWIHSIDTVKNTSLEIQTFLRLVSGQLTHLQRISELAIDLAPFVVLSAFVLIAAYFILSHIGPFYAFFFVILIISMRLRMTF